MTRLILVLGCHRSGTSAIAGSLRALGVRFGPRANWVGADNPVGFNEDQDVLALDEALLAAAGTSWNRAAPIAWGPWSDGMRAPAIGLLRARLTAFPVFGLKEPRLCRLLPFWRRVFESVRCEVSVVHAIRHPAAVAASLMTRNGMTRDAALALWVEHVTRARAEADPLWPSVTVDYDRLMDCPVREVDRLAGRLDLALDADGFTQFLHRGLRADLRHQEAAEVPAAVAALWEKIRGEAAC